MASMTAPDPHAGAGLPAGLAPPVKVALARAVTKMPRPGALPGTLTWEPKWDGYLHCTPSTRGPSTRRNAGTLARHPERGAPTGG
jgi:hypothetical protein